jgi:hypothetical protein
MQDWRALLDGVLTLSDSSLQTAFTLHSSRGVKNRLGGANLDMSSYKGCIFALKTHGMRVSLQSVEGSFAPPLVVTRWLPFCVQLTA